MSHKKKLGIIGGMGSRAGAVFLQKIIDYSPAVVDQDFLEIIFHNNSQVPDRTRAIVYNDPSPLDAILKSIDLFNQNKVEVIALGCVTSYYYYQQIALHTDATIINPLQLVIDCIKEKFIDSKRVGLLATTGTINSGLFHKQLKENNIEVITLGPVAQEDIFMRSVYMENGFKSARISENARTLMLQSIEGLKALNVDLIIGGCTEVSIGIDPELISDSYIDTLDLLARKTVGYCYGF